MTLALPSRRLAPAWVRNDLWRRARAVPSLDLRFADSKSLVDAVTGQNLITFTRSSSGTYIGSDGLLKTATTNEPRFNHNPTTGESLGLLVEEQRTNSIRNNTMQGAVAGTPGTLPTNWVVNSLGLTRTIVGTGTINGVSYLDLRLNGTTTSGGSIEIKPDGNAGSVTASASQSWSASVWIAVISGSTSNITSQSFAINEYTSGIAYLRSVTFATNILAAGATLTRVTGTATTGATTGVVEPVIFLGASNGATIDITLRIGMPQLEQGAFATSVIPTTGSAATRSADVASITGTNFSSWYRQDEGTVFAGVVAGPIPSGGFPTVLSIEGVTNANRMQIVRYGSGQARPSVITNGVVQAAFDVLPAWALGSAGQVACGAKLNDIAGSANGGAVVTDDTAEMPTLTQLGIGASIAGNAYLNSHIRRLTYWPARLPDATLQAITL